MRTLLHLATCLALTGCLVPAHAASVYTYIDVTGNWNYSPASWTPGFPGGQTHPMRSATPGQGDTANILLGQAVTFNHLSTANEANLAGATVINNAGTLSIAPNTSMTVDNTLNNSGTLQVDSTGQTTASSLIVIGEIKGGGTIGLTGNLSNLTGSGALNISSQTIQGFGTVGYFDFQGQDAFSQIQMSAGSMIHANYTGQTLNLLRDGTVSGGTLQASNGGNLNLFRTSLSGSTVNAWTGSTVVLDTGTMAGGVLNTQGSGAIYLANQFQLGNGVSNLGKVVVADGQRGALAGTISNAGTLQVGSVTGAILYADTGTTLTGGGTLNLNPGSVLRGTLGNWNNAVYANGAVSNEAALTNYGSLSVTDGATFDNAFGASFNNQGYLRVGAGATLSGYWQNAAPNATGGTLSGGTFDIAGVWQGASVNLPAITNNTADLILDGPGSVVTYMGGGGDALAGLNKNSGSFTIKSGRNFTTAGNFTNQGALSIGAGSTFTVGGGGTLQQTAGSTIVNGVLAVGTLDLAVGTLGGSGEIKANVLLSGTLNPGNSPGTITVTGNLVQGAGGVLNMELQSIFVNGFDRLVITGDAEFDGLLNLILAGYAPQQNDVFNSVLSWGGKLTLGQTFHFAGLDLGNGYSLLPEWGSNSLNLVVNGPTDPGPTVPEAGTVFMTGGALLAAAWFARRRAR